MGVIILGANTLYINFCFFKQIPMASKLLINYTTVWCFALAEYYMGDDTIIVFLNLFNSSYNWLSFSLLHDYLSQLQVWEEAVLRQQTCRVGTGSVSGQTGYSRRSQTVSGVTIATVFLKCSTDCAVLYSISRMAFLASERKCSLVKLVQHLSCSKWCLCLLWVSNLIISTCTHLLPLHHNFPTVTIFTPHSLPSICVCARRNWHSYVSVTNWHERKRSSYTFL